MKWEPMIDQSSSVPSFIEVNRARCSVITALLASQPNPGGPERQG
jgi:hypothetical protein